VSCNICGAEGPATSHEIWYARASELQADQNARPSLYRCVVQVCDGCVVKDIAHFRRLQRKAPAIAGAIVAVVAGVGVAVAILVSEKTPSAAEEALVGGVAFGVFAGGAIAAAVAVGLGLRTDPKRVVQGLVIANADRIGLTGCIGFWLKRPFSFQYGGRTFR
jgi:hypothetical protein